MAVGNAARYTDPMSESPSCPGCQALLLRVAELEARLRQVEALLARNSSNSSTPPSANPPAAPAAPAKKPSGRKPGAQPGHQGHPRTRLPASRVSSVIAFVPKACAGCGEPLHAQKRPGDPEPTWHQVLELPEQPVAVTEYQGHARLCPCGAVTREPVPAAIRAEGFGPRLSACFSLLASWQHVSLRGLQDVSLAMLGAPVSMGALVRLREQMADALAGPCKQLAQEVADAPVKHVDETGWKEAGKRRWLWVAATATAAWFLVLLGRGRQALHDLLGGEPRGVVVSDRWSAYHRIPLERRQLCWAHLKRDFQAMAEATGKAKRAGENLLMLTERMFCLLRRVRDGTRTRAWLRKTLEASVRPDVVLWLKEGASSGHAATEGTCAHILKLEEALWTFARVEGVEPTNNEAERALRPAVVKRKKSFGSHSAEGAAWLGRMLSVTTTLRKRGLAVLDYLVEALRAFRSGETVPLIPPAR